jgi:tripartite-type tricarboxylate transporter receptor subunit TctC
MNRRNLLAVAVTLMISSPVLSLAQTQPLRVLVGFPPGGSTDAIARHLAAGMSDILQRPVIVENRPGAGGQIAAAALKAAAPDGNTLFLSNSHALSMIPLTVANPGYDTTKDFAAVGMVAISNDVLAVNPKLVGDVTSLKGLIDWANANRGKASVGVPAPASDPDFGVRLLAKEFKSDLNPVPYRGDGPVVQDLIAGQIPAGIGSIGAMAQHAKSGRVRIIAISGPSRLKDYPDVATYGEQGLKGYGVSGFVAMLAPAGTPNAQLQRYNQVINQVVTSSSFLGKISELGVIPTTSTIEELSSRIRETTSSFGALVERVGYKIP